MLEQIKVLIVDDSLVFRNIVEEAMRAEPDIIVTGSVRNGVKALEFIERHRPDLVTLDVEMPDMDGLETLRAINEYNSMHPDEPGTGVIMLSAHTLKGASTTIEALEAGAFDFVTKPDNGSMEANMEALRAQLLAKIKAFVIRRVKSGVKEPAAPPPEKPKARGPADVEAIFIGISTGGPKALSVLLPQLSEIADIPIFIVQHMPPRFTGSLAASLDKKCRHKVVEARDGEVVRENHVYIAPGGMHLSLEKNGKAEVFTMLSDAPQENGCRPSVDVLFRSAASVYGKHGVALIMTGMGVDGAKGLSPLKRLGAYVIAQDEDSSVVWGMPGKAVALGVVDEVLPLDEIATAVEKLTNKQGKVCNHA